MPTATEFDRIRAAGCSLTFAIPDGQRPFGLCVGCGGELPKTKKGRVHPNRRWCDFERCGLPWYRNHDWTSARNEAIRRAMVLLDDAYPWERWVICDDCGGLADAPVEKVTRWGVDGQNEHRYTAHQSPEVNHVEPREGAGYGVGCWNHQTNLQVLCHECHVRETNRQRHERSVLLRLSLGVLSKEEATELLQGRIPESVRRRQAEALKRDRLGELPMEFGL